MTEGITNWVTEWHGVEATEEEAGEVPQCYEPKEWRLFYVAAKVSSGKKKFSGEAALNMACSDCQRDYQEEQLALGRCHPVRFVNTPLFRSDEND